MPITSFLFSLGFIHVHPRNHLKAVNWSDWIQPCHCELHDTQVFWSLTRAASLSTLLSSDFQFSLKCWIKYCKRRMLKRWENEITSMHTCWVNLGIEDLVLPGKVIQTDCHKKRECKCYVKVEANSATSTAFQLSKYQSNPWCPNNIYNHRDASETQNESDSSPLARNGHAASRKQNT